MRLGPLIDYAALAPALAVAVAALVALVADLVAPYRRVLPALSLLGIGAALLAVAGLALGDPRSTFCQPAGTLPAAVGGAPVPVSCSYVADDLALLLQALVLLAAAGTVALSQAYLGRERLPAGEYHFLLLTSTAGMVTLAASRDLVLLVLALEVVSVPAIVLAGLRRADPRSAEAALKFFLVSVLSTAVMLLGMALVYGVTGSVQLDRIAVGLGSDPPPVAAAGVVLVLAGFGFKVSAVPFHAWAPDTYEGAPLPVAVFLAVASKAAGFAGLLAVLSRGFPAYVEVWGPALGVLAAASMTLGNLVALQQRQVVRLLAWSGVAQTGYLLAPLAVAASIGVDAAVRATLAYLVVYVAMELGTFACVLAVGRGFPTNLLADYRGLARSSPLLAVALAFFLTCLAGLPPGVAGLVAKVVVFRAVVDGGAGWLAVVMALNVVIGLAYYVRLAALLFAPTDAEPQGERVGVPRAVGAVVAATAAVTVVLGFAPQLVLRAAG